MISGLGIAGKLAFDARILHVEEDSAWQRLAERILKTIDADVDYVSASTPEEGINKLQKEGPFNGVITAGDFIHFVVPRGSGLQGGLTVVDAANEMPEKVPVIMLANYSDESEFAEEVRGKRAEFIPKRKFVADFKRIAAQTFYGQ